MQSLSTLRLFGLGCLVAATQLATTDARADDDHVAAHDAGVALTATGAVFLVISVPAAAGTTLALLESAQPSDGPTMGALAIGAVVLAGCTVIGLSTLIPGVILMNRNKPAPHAGEILRDAHAAPPLPRFTYVPLVSARF